MYQYYDCTPRSNYGLCSFAFPSENSHTEQCAAADEQERKPESPVAVAASQAFFREDVDGQNYHELCAYFLVDISNTDILSKERFTLQERHHIHDFEWLEFERLKTEYFYPLFLKSEIFNLPDEFTIRAERE